MFKKKKILILSSLVVLVMVTSGVLVTFWLTSGSRTFKNGGVKLAEEKKYVVATTLETPEGNLGYLEVTTPDGNYTEYKAETSKDSKSNGGVTSGSNYMLYDWLTTDGKLYTLNSSYVENDTKSSMWMFMPEEYAKSLSERRTLYYKSLLSGMSDIKEGDTKEVDLGYSSKSTVQEYTCKIDSGVIKSMLGIDTLGLYNSLLSESKSKGDENLQKLMEKYISDKNKTLTFSDGDMTFQIFDGKLVGYTISCGGLGSTMKISKNLVMSDVELRALPDFESNLGAYYDTVKTYADFVADYPSEEEAKKALDSKK